MKYFRELLTLSHITKSNSKIYEEHLPEIDNLESHLLKKYSKETVKKASEKTDEICKQIDNSDTITAITIFDREYPEHLKKLKDDAPPLLFVVGSVETLALPNLGVVGDRKPDITTQNFEYKFIRSVIEESERVILGGLELGCEKIAHTVAADMGEKSIAVLPSGINNITPEDSIPLAKLIVENEGCIISSFKPDAKPIEKRYSDRNLYIAALSDGIFLGEVSSYEKNAISTVTQALRLYRKIGCFLPENVPNLNFAFNESILSKAGSLRIKNLDDVDEFLNFIKTKIKRKYQSKLTDF